DEPASAPLFDELYLACVCPHGDSCWWADRLCANFDARVTPERFLLDQIVPYFERQWGLASPALGLLGIGMGWQGVLRLQFKYPNRFPLVTALGPAIDHHELYYSGTPLDEMYNSAEQCRQDTATLHVHPSDYPPHISFASDPDDLWHRGNDRL